MPDTQRASAGAIGASILLCVPILVLWIASVAGLTDLGRSDAAGNAMGEAFAGIALVALWILLAILTIVAAIKGVMPLAAMIAALSLLPASGYAALSALDLVSHPFGPPYRWPILIPALVPPLIVAFCFWSLVPALRAAIPARVAVPITWGGVFLLCAYLVPMHYLRDQANEQEAAIWEKYAADFERVAPDSPLWDYVPFLAAPDQTLVEKALDRIRHLDRRQSDAEVMLDRGDFPLGYLGRFDLDPTPAICDKARALLARRVEPLVLNTPNSKPYADIRMAVSDAVAAMSWLVGYDCPCNEAAQAWQTMSEAYQGTDFDQVRLRELRDTKELGRVLREYPEHFSMLTPKAHLKAWLKYADEKEYHDQAIVGARALDHRTADAIEMLRGDEFAGYPVVEYLPELDLETTPALCAAALWNLHGRFAKIYRPKEDDPRSYRELLERFGRGDPLEALIWLASHGCDAEAQLSEAESLIGTYQDSPARTAMLATLAKRHRTP